MEFLKANRRFDFLYDGKALDECNFTVTQNIDDNTVTTVYSFEDGLKVKNIAKKHENPIAYEWVNYFENTSDKPTKIISELFDCYFESPFEHEDVRKWEAYFPDSKTATKIFAPSGSTWSADEFYCNIDKIVENKRINHIYPGQTKEYSTGGGRSSVSYAPFFNVSKNDSGIIFAIGWTGQWNAKISRDTDSVTIKTKIEDTHFRLLAGEVFRTSSIVIMPYVNGLQNAHNAWRKLLKNDFSLIGQPGRDEVGPLCASVWGGMKTESVLKRIKTIKDNNIPFEYLWMDAGWYGKDTKPTPDEFEGDWGIKAGDWRVSKLIHPKSLKDVSEAAHNAGLKFLLWFEAERAIFSTPITQEHPEYLLSHPGSCPWDYENKLLNLGNPDALEYCFNTIASLIKDLNIDCYRQDFNFAPLPYWRKNDADDRRGISEIKYINGLYTFLDRLLEIFPHLLIDNCASGGRRIDIEMLRRSFALWRTDYMCPANYDDYVAQCHALNFNTWLPYSGTGTGRLYDLYRVRSAYGASLATGFSSSEREEFADTPEKIEFIKHFCEEYKKVRPYYSEDFYPLTKFSDQLDTWCAYQFDRPEENDGLIQIFRRDEAPYEVASFTLGGICEDKNYIFTDADDNSKISISGKELKETGFKVEIKEKRTAKIYFYTYN